MTNPIDAQRASFNALVEDGVYSAAFEHASPLIGFYRDVVAEALGRWPTDRPLTVLDAGCGTGAWLAVLADLFAERGQAAQLAGFDLSDKMVAVAREKLGSRVGAANLRQGNALDPSAYRFPDVPQGFDLIVAYDLIQQLPPSAQSRGVDIIISALGRNGQAVIFDHDRHSPYGRTMGFKKFVTRHLFIPLVPRYYCNARYPALRRLQQEIDRRPGTVSRLHARDTLTKVALQIVTPE